MMFCPVTFYNNLLTIPVLAVASLLLEDWSSTNLQLNFPPNSRSHMFVGILYSGFMAVFISFSTAWCVRATSSTTYAMVGALNKLPLAIIGLVFFAVPITFGSVTAIVLGFISGIVYAVAKTQKSQPLTVLPIMSASAQSITDASWS
jgi:GDP-mannose transporter